MLEKGKQAQLNLKHELLVVDLYLCGDAECYSRFHNLTSVMSGYQSFCWKTHWSLELMKVDIIYLNWQNFSSNLGSVSEPKDKFVI